MAGLASKRARTVFVLVLALAALGGAYALASGMADAEGEGSLAAGEPFLSVSSEEIAEVTWTYGGATATMVKEDGTWADAEAAGVSLDQSTAAELASAAADASSSRSVARSQEDAAMGLESPTVRATLVLTDGSSVSFEVGAATADGASCYAWRQGSEDVQVVDIALLNAFSCSMADLYVTESAPGSSSVTAFEVDRGGDVLSMTYLEEGSDAAYSSSYQWFLQDGDALRALDTSKARTLANVVNRITWKSCVDTAYADDAAATYGFDDPVLTATLSYTNDDEPSEYVLVVGSKASSSTYYAHPAGSTYVYTVAAEKVEDLLEATYETLRPDDVCLMDWDTVDALDIVCDGEATTVSFVRTEEQDDDGETVVSTSYEVDGASADASAVSSLTDTIDGMESEGEGTIDAAQGGADAELAITFHRTASTYETMTLSFIRYDNSFCLVSFNGEERLLVNRNDVAALKEAVQAL